MEFIRACFLLVIIFFISNVSADENHQTVIFDETVQCSIAYNLQVLFNSDRLPFPSCRIASKGTKVPKALEGFVKLSSSKSLGEVTILHGKNITDTSVKREDVIVPLALTSDDRVTFRLDGLKWGCAEKRVDLLYQLFTKLYAKKEEAKNVLKKTNILRRQVKRLSPFRLHVIVVNCTEVNDDNENDSGAGEDLFWTQNWIDAMDDGQKIQMTIQCPFDFREFFVKSSNGAFEQYHYLPFRPFVFDHALVAAEAHFNTAVGHYQQQTDDSDEVRMDCDSFSINFLEYLAYLIVPPTSTASADQQT